MEIIVIVGPTASGKTEVALSLAKRINAQIISADSMQIYKGMDIITSKPTSLQQKSIAHHMLDILEPTENFSAAEFGIAVSKTVDKLIKKGKPPIVVGGSGLYIKAIIDGIFKGPGADLKIRKRLQKEADSKGSGFLYERLRKIDPDAAADIHPNDARRIVRALEVYEKTKIPISKLKKDAKGLFSRYDVRIFGLKRERKDLYYRIDKRVDKMFRQGLIEEVRKLSRRNLSQTAAQALGLKEIQGCLRGEYPKGQAKELLKRNTRRFAKRQLTWFRKDKRIIWIDVKTNDKPEAIAGRIWKRLY